MSQQRQWRLLVFGATGAIGSTVTRHALARGWKVVAASRRPPDTAPDEENLHRVCHDPLSGDSAADLVGEAPFDAVCWAHGANLADSVQDFDAARHLALYEANCLSVLVSTSSLIKAGLLSRDGARLVIVSSIWQERARQNKLSYSVTKAAVGGIVRSLAVDLGSEGHLVNGVLPGVLDTPMTAANLDPAQVEVIRGKTTAHRLPDLGTVAETILFLCSTENRSVTSQSIPVDLGMSNAILV
ncbi:MAG: SDR family oxidoreductase [Novosphingobium sp.]|nr:SDR family oxidoreductase [Novosphingobium sp.]